MGACVRDPIYAIGISSCALFERGRFLYARRFAGPNRAAQPELSRKLPSFVAVKMAGTAGPHASSPATFRLLPRDRRRARLRDNPREKLLLGQFARGGAQALAKNLDLLNLPSETALVGGNDALPFENDRLGISAGNRAVDILLCGLRARYHFLQRFRKGIQFRQLVGHGRRQLAFDSCAARRIRRARRRRTDRDHQSDGRYASALGSRTDLNWSDRTAMTHAVKRQIWLLAFTYRAPFPSLSC